MVVVTIVGVGGGAAMQLVLLVAAVVTLEETTTGVLLLDTTGIWPHSPLFVVTAGVIVEAVADIATMGACCMLAAVEVTIAGVGAVEEAIVMRGGGTMFIGC